MIYIDEDPEVFAKKYKIEIETIKCSQCGKMIICDVPIAIKGYRGLQMRKHGCEDRRLAANFVPVDKSEIDFWNNII